VEVEHVAERAVGQGGAEDGDVVLWEEGIGKAGSDKRSASKIQSEEKRTHLVAPIVNRLLIVDLLSQPPDNVTRRPNHALLPDLVLPSLLLLHHPVQDRQHPILKRAIVRVRHNEIPNPIHALAPQLPPLFLEPLRGEVGLPEALDKVFFDAAGGGDEAGDEGVFDEVEDDFAQAGGD
jgi:hypothetical protein